MEVIEATQSEVLAGFRLHSLEVLNWGTFNKKKWKIEPSGHNALLTGDIGSGKSTLVDALTCLLVPHNRITFNKAAGAEGKERTLLSYVKGEYKKEKGEITKGAKKIYLRPDDNTYSVIIGSFYNTGYDETVCLTQVFWIGKEGKVEKLMIISTETLTIAEHFSNFSDINELKKKLRARQTIVLLTDNFTQYSEQFRRLFGMNSDKAIDLFYQTVSMKSVSSLTEFVREQMLEKTDVKEQVASLLKRFDDLKKSHEAVMHAREQYQILKPLTEDAVTYGELQAQIEELEIVAELIPAWFAGQKQMLLQQAIDETKSSLEQAQIACNTLGDERAELERKKLSILQDIENNGGKRLEQIATEIAQHGKEKDLKQSAYKDYERLIKSCKLSMIDSEADFLKNIEQAKLNFGKCEELELELRQQRDNIVSELRKTESEWQSEYRELQSLQDRETQIPDWLIRFRQQLCNDLEISDNELPFMGELLKVQEEEQGWEGAIEKLLHDAGISLLVPRNHYRSVSQYINNNQLKSQDGRGIKITYLEADLDNLPQVRGQLDEDSVVYKVAIKPDTEFYDWVDRYLQRSFGDFVCVNVQDLEHVPYAITKQGLIKSGRIRHTKDDRRRIDDRRNYVLGWSNIEKVKALEESIDHLHSEIIRLKGCKSDIEQQSTNNDAQKQVLSRLTEMRDYSRINWKYHTEKIYELAIERDELLSNNNTLSLLHRKKDEVEQAIQNISEKLTAKNEEVGELKGSIKMYEQQFENATSYISQIDEKKKEKFFHLIEERLPNKNFQIATIDQEQEKFRKLLDGDNGELKKLRQRSGTLRSSIERRMREIKDHSKAEYSEISENIDARGEYLDKFNRLVNEDLKRHEERFKDELTKNTINSIAVFDSKLQQHEKDIKQKIRSINQHLYEIVYNSTHDTYITILMDVADRRDIGLFREELKKCYIHSFSSNTELYTEEKYEQVKKILDRFASADPIDKEWTSSVTDVRQWFEFNASERYRADDAEKEFYEGSGGKSGGQKEKLAYTILASALAFQFGLQFGESKSRSFRFVVIDEAFGRGSDESTRYGLELFKKLNLQLLIVTPLQKIHIIEGHVNSFHFVGNRNGDNSQVSNFTKQEYLEEKARRSNFFKQNPEPAL